MKDKIKFGYYGVNYETPPLGYAGNFYDAQGRYIGYVLIDHQLKKSRIHPFNVSSQYKFIPGKYFKLVDYAISYFAPKDSLVLRDLATHLEFEMETIVFLGWIEKGWLKKLNPSEELALDFNLI